MKYLLNVWIAISSLTIISCLKNDDEPILIGGKSISRIYASSSDYQEGAASGIKNIWSVFPADSTDFAKTTTQEGIVGSAKGGKTVHFTPFSDGYIFQSSMNSPGRIDTAIHVFKVDKAGRISATVRLSNRIFDNIRGMQYTVINQGNVVASYLLTVNASDTLGNTFFAIQNPTTAGAYKRPRYRYNLNFNPWGVISINNNMYITNTAAEGGVVVFNDINSKLIANGDTVLSNLNNYEIKIQNSRNLRGLSYSKDKDMMLLTDYDAGTGKILVIENFSQYNSNQTITPTRIITSDKLKQPMDVAIDSRENGAYFYVADPVAKRIFRFKITDTGNVTPEEIILGNNYAPESISLDAR